MLILTKHNIVNFAWHKNARSTFHSACKLFKTPERNVRIKLHLKKKKVNIFKRRKTWDNLRFEGRTAAAQTQEGSPLQNGSCQGFRSSQLCLGCFGSHGVTAYTMNSAARKREFQPLKLTSISRSPHRRTESCLSERPCLWTRLLNHGCPPLFASSSELTFSRTEKTRISHDWFNPYLASISHHILRGNHNTRQ